MFQKIKERPGVFIVGLMVLVVAVAFILMRTPEPQGMGVEELTAQVRQELIASGTHIEGTVVAITDTTITIKTQVGDVDTVEESVRKRTPLQFSDREITINLSPETSYVGFMKNEITTGLIVKTVLSASIYETDHPTALSVERFDLKTQVINEVTQRDMIAGKVLSVRGKTLTIETEVADEEKLDSLDTSSGSFTVPYVTKRYTITITPTTEFLEGKTMSDIVAGAQVTAWGEGNVYSINRFNATKIYLMP
ncbi:MAG: hypothetical protein A2408_01875 [Candidatus Yonathbacteria bacterium RIFOXYC1_FULL_52_10]|uniref:DUF5666 domain-containing protein n=1 Tax=Candidatus Yonathbacteria bacterium RIFOXYD1_FULL_52_36 TaxID=1802730 RepID=A0A1G2SJG9_9BACT|nr:MAG: hypothetical protein A2408_01875 [Candidatus Yonathbacteria bacterium RIFOXYC1_FULL_52_10]OHA84882.1 MAG: hypothetical protein A2591_00970 [Candidatus Yonathbacteria bacterium RIFOXYD1_FULL_52_36]